MKHKISGFTFGKNLLSLGYPVVESIKSLLPLCDEVIVNIGFDDLNSKKDDGTFQFLLDHFSSNTKVIFMTSQWDQTMTQRGEVLAQQTNLALDKCQHPFCHYIQADEVLHEDDYPLIEKGVRQLRDDSQADGLLYDFVHFYSSPSVIRYGRDVYRKEIRLIRNGRNIRSYRDAQGFRHQNNEKLSILETKARIFHYGWARNEEIMQKKIAAMNKFYGASDKKVIFNYEHIWGTRPFKETHPDVMKHWIKEHHSSRNILKEKMIFRPEDIKSILLDSIEKLTSHRLGEYKNYKGH